MSPHPLEEILHPKSIAIAGASETSEGGRYVSALLKLGFKGKIYPVHPKHGEVFGLKCYPGVRDIPENVDFVISTIPATQVLNLVDDCALKGVKCIHFYTARFSETGRKDAIELEREVLRRAKNAGIRIIGPNGMGVYYPAWGMSWTTNISNQPGSMGFISQSGSVAFEIIETAEIRGMHFSKAFSYGNAVDFNECDYLEYLGQDAATKLIVIYIEGVRDGKRFLEILRKTTLNKPVIILKGGRGKSGTRATASHTASLAGSMAVWQTAMEQTGTVSVAHVEELIDVAAAFYFLPAAYGNHVGVAGGGGGGSVMAADLCEEAGLNVIPLPDEIREELKKEGNPVWDWVTNPVDFSIGPRDSAHGHITKMMVENPNFDLNIIFIDPQRNRYSLTSDALLNEFPLADLIKKPLLAVLLDWGRGTTDDDIVRNNLINELKTRLIQMHIPTYPTVVRAANAADKMINFYIKQKANLTD
ncbi:MAG: CoA-binding protein [Dehalococcoidales bacterium]